MMHWARQLDEYFRPKFTATPKYQKSEHDAHNEVLVDKGSNEFYCILCQKTCLGGPWAAQDTHCQSSMHRDRVREHAAVNEMIGRCKTARRFSATPGFMGGIHNGEGGWEGFKDYWGADVLQMPEHIWNRLRAGVVLRVDMPHWGKKQSIVLHHSRVCDIVPGAVTYGGQGKYTEGVDKVLPFGKFDQLIDNDGYNKSPEDREGKGEYQAGQNRGWWPVSVITWHGQHSDHGYPDAAVYFRDMWSGRTRCYVLCWYQLMDGSMSLQVWATFIVSRL